MAEVERSRLLFEAAESTLTPLRRVLDFWHALRWLEPAGGRGGFTDHPGVGPLLRGIFGELPDVLEQGHVESADPSAEREAAAVNELLERVRGITERERFLHWELAFPSVWRGLARDRDGGGFDAVIGNPPWDRLKLQEVEWFAAREPTIARSARASDRKRAIELLAREGDPLWGDYQEARTAAESAARVARESGRFPRLARGDLNIYSLFVERAESLTHPRGVVGLLVPSGIAADKSASEFFREISGAGRLSALFDFENKKVFFPDIHASFKFSILVFGGLERVFDEARLAFFLHSVDELKVPDRTFSLSPEEFAAVNPNTGTAPVFRNRRDAKITAAVYERLPVLVDRSGSEPKASWPIRYVRMFDLTTDSALFRAREELEPLARDLGYDGDPFPWDEEDRRHRMARLDALFFHLYGIEREDADYILNQFPIVRAEDMKAFGRFLTRDLVLAYMNAVAAGDLEVVVRI